MILLCIRTDQEQAMLALYNDYELVNQVKWTAHRELASTIIEKALELSAKCEINLDSINGIVCYEGPGSFTGLRIGLTFANAIGYSEGLPIVAKGEANWIEKGVDALLHGENQKIVLPAYGAGANITAPKK
jgi:tRNA threonylcarbamoyladenosine biosynthesis protein TsaB